MSGASSRNLAGRPFRVFLCHSSADKPVVRELYRRLQADGFVPWIDEQDLLPGQDWREEIPAAVQACDVVLVCLSHNSVTKEGFVQKEIRFALDVAEEKPEGTIFIIPIRMEEVEVPRRLSQWQWANLFDSDGYERLVQALNKRSGTLWNAPSRDTGDVSSKQDSKAGPSPIAWPKLQADDPRFVWGRSAIDPNAVVHGKAKLRLTYSGRLFMKYGAKICVLLDGRLVGTGTVFRGFDIWVEIETGTHEISLTRDRVSETFRERMAQKEKCLITIPASGSYQVQISLGWDYVFVFGALAPANPAG